MKRIPLNGHLHAAPFADVLRALTDQEAADLRASVVRNGVLSPLTVYLSDLHGRAVVDGLNRAAIAADLGLADVPVVSLGRLADDDARELALSLNLDRRHLSAAEQAELAAARRARVAAGAAAGKSKRAIAAAEGVSRAQVDRDLQAAGRDPQPADRDPRPAGGPPGPPDPGRVTGADGKSYPAAREPTPADRVGRAARHGDRLAAEVSELLAGPFAARLEYLARLNGSPIAREGAAWQWPALQAVRAVLTDLAAQGA